MSTRRLLLAVLWVLGVVPIASGLFAIIAGPALVPAPWSPE